MRIPALGLVAALFLSLGCASVIPGDVSIPTQADWTDQGSTGIANGLAGEWDDRLAGISPGAVVKKDGTYYLYYIGADGDRSSDGGPRHRGLGLATSTDGLTYTKYSGNPVISHLPHFNEEEGVFSVAATLDENGNIVLYYGAVWAVDEVTSTVDVYFGLTRSSDGIHFTHIPYPRRTVGAEETPVGVYEHNGTWYVYYINTAGWNLDVLSGPEIDDLPTSQGVLSGGTNIIGGGDVVDIGNGNIAVFLFRDFTQKDIEVRTAAKTSPQTLSAVVETYDFANVDHSSVFADVDTSTWFMYYKEPTADAIHVKTAPLVIGPGAPTPTPTIGPTPTPTPTPLPGGSLVGHWTFNDGMSLQANDEIAGNHGALTNMDEATDWVPGHFGTALDFDGVDDYVSIPFSIDYRVTDFTYSAWVNMTTCAPTAPWNASIVGNEGDGGATLRVGQCIPNINLRASSGWVDAISPDALPTGSWHHVAGSYDGSSLKVYVDGVMKDSTGPWTAHSGQSPASVTHVGRWVSDNSRLCHCQIDDVRIYNYALADSEVLDLSNEVP